MPISLPVHSSLQNSGSTGATERINYDPPTGYLPAPALAHLFTLAPALRGKLHFPFECLPLLMLCSAVINLLNKGPICLTQKMKLRFPRPVIKMNITHGEKKTALTEEKQRKLLLRDEPAPPPPLPLLPGLRLLSHLYFYPYFFSSAHL